MSESVTSRSFRVICSMAWRLTPSSQVNELSAGVVPRDMDTADQAGELFFDLRSVILPIECAGPVSFRQQEAGPETARTLS